MDRQMDRWIVFAAAAALVGIALVACSSTEREPLEPSQPAPPGIAQSMHGEVIVQFRPGTNDERVKQILTAVGAPTHQGLGMPLTFLAKSSGGVSFEELARRLAQFPEVLLTEPNWVNRPYPATTR